VDLAAIRSDYGVALTDQDLVAQRGVSTVPFLAYARPLGQHFGLGFHMGAPHGRTGETAADGPFRLWSISGGIILVENRLSLAWKPTDKWTLGAGLRSGFSFFSMRTAMDTGATLYQLLGASVEGLIGDPLLEGERVVENGRGHGFGYSIGLRYEPAERVVMVVSHHSSLATPLTGTVTIQPSKDLDLVLQADLIGYWRYPMEVHVGLSVPMGALDVHANAEYIGWGSTTSTLATLNDPVVLSESPFLSGILHDYGLDDPTVLGTLHASSQSGMQNILTGGLHVSWQANPQWMFLCGASYTPGAIRDEWISPANIDMDGIDYRLGSQWTVSARLQLGLSLDIWILPDRVIRNSNGDPRNTVGNPTTPSANGRYSLAMQRLGFSSRFRF
jgi:long-subunit fatty acid transport protein